MERKKIEIIDTTLRDGEQTAGVAFSHREKLHIANVLNQLRVDVIEAGVPAMGKEEKDVIYSISQMGLDAKVLAWSRMRIKDIQDALETTCHQVHVAVPASDLHIYKKMNMTPDEVIDQMRRVIAYAVEHELPISIGAEDASRAKKSFLERIYQEAQKEGAIRIRYADTVGIMDPFEAYEKMSELTQLVDIEVDYHAHNDLGLATANALGGIRGGARTISCSINGLGERAGNSSLEEVAVMLALKDEYVTGIDLKQLYQVSQIVERYSGRKVHEGKPIVGEKVFAHEAGIHVAGLIKDREIYEGLTPELVGRESQFVLGKHSGRAGVIYEMNKKGIEITEEELDCTMLYLRKKGRMS